MKLNWRWILPPITFLNGVSYLIISELVGGSALWGKVINSTYYLWERGDAEYHQLSAWVFHYSWWHGVLLILNLIAFILMVVIEQYQGRRRHRKT